MQLTHEQIAAVRNGEAVRLDENGMQYVVVRADLYDRLKQLMFDDGEWTDAELRRVLANSAGANGWNEPEMDDYDRYDEEIQKRCP